MAELHAAARTLSGASPALTWNAEAAADSARGQGCTALAGHVNIARAEALVEEMESRLGPIRSYMLQGYQMSITQAWKDLVNMERHVAGARRVLLLTDSAYSA
jgi:hypothetical protein